MSPIDQLSQDLKAQFPDCDIEIRKADDPSGFQFLNLLVRDYEVSIEWKSELGFGISPFNGNSLTEGLFDSPKEWHSSKQEVLHRVISMISQK